MRARAIKALFIAVAMIVAMWIGLPILEKYAPAGIFYADRRYTTPDDNTLSLSHRFGFHRGSTYLYPMRDLLLQNLGNADDEPIAELEYEKRAIPNWMTPQSGFSKNDRSVRVAAVGWPNPMVRWFFLEQHYTHNPASTAMYELKSVPSRKLNLLTVRGVEYPVGPIWSGLAINLLFWWLLAFGVLSIPLRPWLRCRKGLCPKCAYDLKRDFEPGCPECGWGREDSPDITE